MFFAPLKSQFSRGPWPSTVYIVASLMVQIDRAGEDDSNGGHIVKFDGFDLWFENSGSSGGFRAADDFLALVLTETIGLKSSNQANCTPNR